MVARSQNALRGQWENLWAAEQVCVVRLVDREDVLRKLVYTITNPVKDHLVDKVHHWPGVNSWAALRSSRPLRANRPTHFFRANGPMPKVIEFQLVIPPDLGSYAEIVEELGRRIATFEASIAVERLRTNRRVLRRGTILRQSWRAQPQSHEPRRGLRPRVAAHNRQYRIEALQRNREFLEGYREARTRWIGGEIAVFPPGTYWLRRFARVPLTLG